MQGPNERGFMRVSRVGLHHIFPGDSQMARRMRAHDWSNTVLGQPTSWPSHLRVALGICLRSKIPSQVLWGSDLVLLYNDAFIPFLDPSRQPRVLGSSAHDALAEYWEQLGPVVDQALLCNGPSRSEILKVPADRLGAGGEAYVAVYCRPVFGADGRIDGAYCSYSGVRRIPHAAQPFGALEPLLQRVEGKSEARYQAVFEAMDEGFCIIEMIFDDKQTPIDYRFLEVNPAFERQTGLSYAVGKTMKELVPHHEQHWFEVYGRIALTGEATRFELPAQGLGRWYDVFAFRVGNPKDHHVAILFKDETERRRTEIALRASEERYRSMFNTMNDAFAICELVRNGQGVATDYQFLEVNPAFEKEFETSRAQIVGRLRSEVFASDQFPVLDYAHTVISGQSVRCEVHATETNRWYDVSVFPRARDSFAVRLDNITVRKTVSEALRENESRQAFIVRLTDALRTLTEPTEIQAITARLLGKQIGSNRVVYFDVIEGGHAVSSQSYVKGVSPIAGRFEGEEFSDSVLLGFLRGEQMVFDDVASDVRLSESERKRFASLDVASMVAIGIVRNGRWVGGIVVHQSTLRVWTPAEIMLIAETAERSWPAIERVHADKALQETQRQLEGALTVNRMAYWSWNRATNDVAASPSISDVLGLHDGISFSKRADYITLVHPDDRLAYDACVAEALEQNEGWHCEFRIVRPRDGKIAWLEERAIITPDPQTRALHAAGMVWDITDRKRAEAAVERERAERQRDGLRRQLDAAQEEERRRLSRELHDEIGQHLTALGLGLQSLLDVTPSNPEVDRRAGQLRALVSTLGRELHSLALRLRPKALDDFGLEIALAAYVDEWSRSSGIAVDVHADQERTRLPEPIESALYRVVQEALTNVARHSGATRASVVIERRNNAVVTIIEDTGRGFDTELVDHPRNGGPALGLLGIRERVSLLGGTVEIESSPNSGTTIFVRIPLRSPAEPDIRPKLLRGRAASPSKRAAADGSSDVR
jgi:PAS domain S-box-containing protein